MQRANVVLAVCAGGRHFACFMPDWWAGIPCESCKYREGAAGDGVVGAYQRGSLLVHSRREQRAPATETVRRLQQLQHTKGFQRGHQLVVLYHVSVLEGQHLPWLQGVEAVDEVDGLIGVTHAGHVSRLGKHVGAAVAGPGAVRPGLLRVVDLEAEVAGLGVRIDSSHPEEQRHVV